MFDNETGADKKVSATNSLFAGNTGGNTNRALTSLGYNLSDDSSLGFTATGDLANTAAGAGTLADNGGATRTVALTSGSAALDAANPASTRTTDQRGIATFGGRADIGAYEYNPAGFAPTVTSLANQTIAEDQALAPLGFTISDFETSAASLVVTATSSNTALVPNGSIVLGGTGANRTVGLTPAANAHSTASGTATITVSVSDSGNTTSTSFVVTVNAVNDRPTITLPASLAVDEDTALVLTGSNAPLVDDVDAGTAAVQVTLAVAQGRLTLSQTTGLAFVTGTGSGDLSMRFSGSVTDINAALQGLRYLPGSNFNGSDRLELTINDLGNSGAGGALSASAGVDITVLARNDAPTLSLPGPQATAQPITLALSAANGNAITLADEDAGSAVLQLTLDAVNGAISLGSLTGLTLIEGDGANDTRFIARGDVSALNAALDTLSFKGTLDGAARIDIAVDDLGNTGAGTLTPTTGSVAISVSANARPVLTLGSTTLSFTEGDTALRIDPALTVTDSDSATLSSARVRISAGYSADDVLGFVNDSATMGNISGVYSAGVLTLTSTGPSATPAQWQAALQAVTYFNASTAPSTATRTLSLTVNDGNADSAARQVTLSVVAVNDAPSGADLTLTLAEDTSRVLTLADFGFSDSADAAANNFLAVRITTTVGAGLLALDGTPVTDGQVVAASAIDAGRLSFAPAAQASGSNYASLGFQVQDDGGTANGGIDLDPITRTLRFDVTPVNDAPVGSVTITGPGAGAPAEDETLTASHTLSDADGPATLAVSYQWQADGVDIDGEDGSTLVLGQAQVGRVITVVARYLDALDKPESVTSAGTLAVANVDDAPTGTVTISGTARQGQTLTAAHDLADADGPTTLAVDYQWQADGADIVGATEATLLLGEAQVGRVITVIARYADNFGNAASVPSAGTVAVANVNDAPSGANLTLTLAEDTSRVLTLADFGFSDSADAAANNFLAVRITTTVGVGLLTLDGAPVTDGQMVLASAIADRPTVFRARSPGQRQQLRQPGLPGARRWWHRQRRHRPRPHAANAAVRRHAGQRCAQRRQPDLDAGRRHDPRADPGGLRLQRQRRHHGQQLPGRARHEHR